MATKIRFVNKDKSRFFPVLKQRVDAYFKENNLSRNANGLLIFKIAFYVIGLISAYTILVFFTPSIPLQYLLWVCIGLFAAFSGLGICHDAIHGSLFASGKWNRVFGFYFNVLGANDYMWSIMHNVVHHTYTNIEGHDEDLESVPFLRMSPHKKRKPIHRLQHILAIPTYGLASLSWVFVKDYVKYAKGKIGNHEIKKHPKGALAKIIIGKLIHYSLFIVVPFLLIQAPWYHILLGFLLMHYIEGLTLAIIFMLAHVVEECHFPLPNEEDQIEMGWAAHQMYTTANFARRSKIVSFFCGGLNYQIEHHLFPLVAHVHLPAISHIVKETAHEFDLPYYENRTFFGAVRSHLRFLKRLGTEG